MQSPPDPRTGESSPIEEPIYERSYWADELDSEDEALVLVEISERGLAEPEVVETLAQTGKTKKARKESQQLKMALKRDRGFWKKKRRLTPSQLMLITKRGSRGEVGHWHKECKSPRRPREKGDGRGRPRPGGPAVEAF
eukprot:6007191-Pyramimonas_sp.AAC.1